MSYITTDAAATSCVAVPNYAAITDLTQFTVGIWVRIINPDSISGGRAMQKGGEGARYEWTMYGTSGRLNFYAARWGTTGGNWYSGGPFSFNTWYHWVVSYDYSSTANNPKMYINTTLQTLTRDSAPAGTLLASDVAVQNLVIGNSHPTAGALRWNGPEAEACVFNRILTAQEVMHWYCRGPLHLPGLVCYVPLGLGSPEPNYSPQGAAHNGVSNNATRNGSFGGGRKMPFSQMSLWGFDSYAAVGGQTVRGRSFSPACIG